MPRHNRYSEPWTLHCVEAGLDMPRLQTTTAKHVSHSCMYRWILLTDCHCLCTKHVSQRKRILFPRIFLPSHPVSTESINWINLNAELVELVIPRSLFFNSKPFVWQLIKLLSNYPTFVQVMSFPTKLWWLRLDTITKSETRQKSNFISCSEGPFVCKICCDLEFQQVNQPIVKVFPTRTNLSVHFHLFVSFIKLRW